jgi:hypothetical protein
MFMGMTHGIIHVAERRAQRAVSLRKPRRLRGQVSENLRLPAKGKVA